MRASRVLLVVATAAVTPVAAAALGERRLLGKITGTAAPDGWVAPRFPDGVELMVPTDDGAELRVAIAGPDAGAPVVLVHGLTSSHDDWGPVAHRLVELGHRVIGINQRGHGGSTVGGEGYGPRRQGIDVGQVLCGLDLHDVTLVGHSMGGVAAMSLMVLEPEHGAERVARQVLVATLADAQRADRRAALRLAERPNTAVVNHPRHGPAAARFAFGAVPSEAMVRDALASAARCPTETRTGASLGLLGFDIRPELPGIDVATVVVCGGRDLVTPLAENRRIAQAIPGAELVIVPDAGHLVIWEAPDAIVDAIQHGPDPDVRTSASRRHTST